MSDKLSDADSINRRSVLKSMGATGAAVAGLSGVASAEGGARDVSAEEAATVLESHAGGVLEALSESGFVSEAAISGFALDESTLQVVSLSVGESASAPTLAAQGVLGNDEVNVFVNLDTGEAHAADTGGETVVFYRDGRAVEAGLDPEASDCDVPGPNSCSNGCTSDIACGILGLNDTVTKKSWDSDICDCNIYEIDNGNCC